MTSLSYLELPAPHLSRTKSFYTAAFGWEWIDYGPTYATTTNSSLEVGLNGLAVPSPAHGAEEQDAIGPFPLFSTSDLDDTYKAVAGAGGVIISEPYGFPGGRRFHFQDPSGNILGVFQTT